MKQILQQFTLRASLLVMLLVGAVSGTWGETTTGTITFGPKEGSTSISSASVTGNDNLGNTWTITTVGTTSFTANATQDYSHIGSGSKPATSITFTTTLPTEQTITSFSAKFGGFSGTAGSVTLKVGETSVGTGLLSGTKDVTVSSTSSATGTVLTVTVTGISKGVKAYNISYSYEESGSTTETCATPTFTPDEGTYTSAQNVTISTTTDGATVYYTTDGTKPTTSSSVYSSPITVSQTTTIKAIAVKEGMDNSAVAEATYTINIPETNVNWVETSLVNLTASDVFVIVGNTYAMTNNNGTESAPVAVSVTIADGKITSTVDDNMKWTISGNATDGYTFYPSGSTTTWLYCNTTAGSSSNNNMRVGTGDRKLFKPNNNGYFVTNDTYTARYISIYNNSDWRGYTSTSNGAVALKFYKRVSANEPTLTASDVELAYDAISGSIAYTLNNATGGTLSATSTADWLTIGTIGESVPFTCDANSTASERTATVTLTYSLISGGTLTATATVTQAANPNAVSTIAEVRSQGTGSVQTKGVVTSVNGKTAYIQDATAAIAVYNSAAELTVAVGDEIKVSGTLGTYNGLLQIQSPTINVISNGNTVTPEVMTISQVNASNNQGWLVKIEEAKVTEITDKNVTIAQGENTIVVRFNNTEDITVTENDIITLTGNIGCFNTTKQIANPTDISVMEIVEPLITVDPTSIEVAFGGEEGNISVTYENLETDDINIIFYTSAEAETTTTCSWIDAIFDEMNNVQYTIAVNEGAARTAYMKIHGLDSNGGDVYSELITISQGAQTVPVTDSKYVKVTSTDDLTSGQYLIVYEDGSVAFNGGLETLDAVGNTIEVELDNNEIAATTQTAAAEFTIDVTEGTIKSASGYYIGRTTDANGMNSSATETYTNTLSLDADGNADIVSSGGAYLRYNSASDQTRFRYYKSASYSSQKAIQLYKKVEESHAITVTIGPVGYTTFVAPADVSFPEGVEAFIVTAISTSSIHMRPVTAVPSGTPVVVRASEGTHELSVATETDDVADNLLLASNGNVTGDGTIYALGNKNAGVGFYPVKSGAKVPEGKAYLEVNNDNVKEFFSFDFGGLVTEISNVSTDADANAKIYNLAGQRVQKVQKGFYIVGGKKVLVK